MKKSISLYLLAVLILATIMACASLQSNTYKTLSVSKTTYDTVMSMAADLYNKGKLSDMQKDQIVILGNKYKEAHNVAVLAFKKANASGLLSDEQDYLSKLSTASKILSDLLTFIQPYIEEN